MHTVVYSYIFYTVVSRYQLIYMYNKYMNDARKQHH